VADDKLAKSGSGVSSSLIVPGLRFAYPGYSYRNLGRNKNAPQE
jgi:hypothetical protein